MRTTTGTPDFWGKKFHFPRVSPGRPSADRGARGLWERDWLFAHILVSRAKAAPVKRSEKGYGDENGAHMRDINLVPRVHGLHGQRMVAQVKLWGNGIFYPRNLGFRLLCACFARKTEVKNWKKTEGSGVRRKYSELHSLDMQLVKSSGSTLLWVI